MDACMEDGVLKGLFQGLKSVIRSFMRRSNEPASPLVASDENDSSSTEPGQLKRSVKLLVNLNSHLSPTSLIWDCSVCGRKWTYNSMYGTLPIPINLTGCGCWPRSMTLSFSSTGLETWEPYDELKS